MQATKMAVLERIIEEVRAQIKNAERGQLSAVEDSKAHKGAMASRYDSFKEEAQQLASGYGVQISELNMRLGTLVSLKQSPPTITQGSVYSIIEVESIDDGSRIKYFLLPWGGGDTYDVNGEEIIVISLGAPIAQALIGAIVDNVVKIRIQETMRRFSIVSVN